MRMTVTISNAYALDGSYYTLAAYYSTTVITYCTLLVHDFAFFCCTRWHKAKRQFNMTKNDKAEPGDLTLCNTDAEQHDWTSQKSTDDKTWYVIQKVTILHCILFHYKTRQDMKVQNATTGSGLHEWSLDRLPAKTAGIHWAVAPTCNLSIFLDTASLTISLYLSLSLSLW